MADPWGSAEHTLGTAVLIILDKTSFFRVLESKIPHSDIASVKFLQIVWRWRLIVCHSTVLHEYVVFRCNGQPLAAAQDLFPIMQSCFSLTLHIWWMYIACSLLSFHSLHCVEYYNHFIKASLYRFLKLYLCFIKSNKRSCFSRSEFCSRTGQVSCHAVIFLIFVVVIVLLPRLELRIAHPIVSRIMFCIRNSPFFM